MDWTEEMNQRTREYFHIQESGDAEHTYLSGKRQGPMLVQKVFTSQIELFWKLCFVSNSRNKLQWTWTKLLFEMTSQKFVLGFCLKYIGAFTCAHHSGLRSKRRLKSTQIPHQQLWAAQRQKTAGAPWHFGVKSERGPSWIGFWFITVEQRLPAARYKRSPLLNTNELLKTATTLQPFPSLLINLSTKRWRAKSTPGSILAINQA